MPSLSGIFDNSSNQARSQLDTLNNFGSVCKPLSFFGIVFKLPKGSNADVAQLVEHNLAKVGVASSNLVIRSHQAQAFSTVEWPRGEAAACKAVHTGSNPVFTSMQCTVDWRSGSALP
jgi:hypothetical protein